MSVETVVFDVGHYYTSTGPTRSSMATAEAFLLHDLGEFVPEEVAQKLGSGMAQLAVVVLVDDYNKERQYSDAKDQPLGGLERDRFGDILGYLGAGQQGRVFSESKYVQPAADTLGALAEHKVVKAPKQGRKSVLPDGTTSWSVTVGGHRLGNVIEDTAGQNQKYTGEGPLCAMLDATWVLTEKVGLGSHHVVVLDPEYERQQYAVVALINKLRAAEESMLEQLGASVGDVQLKLMIKAAKELLSYTAAFVDPTGAITKKEYALD